ncbi:hypothetical protein [uncultured Megasphaera sp.]|uniref:hypothetical protein n=1 Tax=uncultured Megasphaera sp. TaxID=165188 RepID=UPI00259716A6|nr:hypothetical protein [uncultured Megasphaera sp.]
MREKKQHTPLRISRGVWTVVVGMGLSLSSVFCGGIGYAETTPDMSEQMTALIDAVPTAKDKNKETDKEKKKKETPYERLLADASKEEKPVPIRDNDTIADLVATLQPLAPLSKEDAKTIAAWDSVVIAPLTKEDINIGGIYRGMSGKQLIARFGQPQKRQKKDRLVTWTYEQPNQSFHCELRMTRNGKEEDALVEAMTLTKGQDIDIGRKIHLNMPTEQLLCTFGVPHNVLRDVKANVYYIIYEQADTDLIFAVAERRIQRVAFMPARYPYHNEQAVTRREERVERDFSLMGYSLGDELVKRQYNMWKSKLHRGSYTVWLYGDYGVLVNAKGNVERIFLLTNSGYTSRGVTLGYRLSTVLALYGQPEFVVWGKKDEGVDVYYYHHPVLSSAYLAIVIKRETQRVDDVIVTAMPLVRLQDQLARYGLP